jgi:hypothetical protein
MSALLTNFHPPGPVAEEFMRDVTSLFPAIMGPVGSGKTTTVIWKRFAHAAMQPVCRDGIRRSKAVHIHTSFRDLEKTLLASWLQWWPKKSGYSDWTGGNDRPAVHTLRLDVRGVTTEIISEFRGLGDESAESALRGWEGDFGHLVEMDLLAPGVSTALIGRLALRRYPGGGLLPEGVRPHIQMVGDLNAPDVDSWVYRDFIEAPKPGYKLYRQPGGLSPNAENRARAALEDYQRMAATMADWEKRRYIDNQFGYSRDGKPVYAEFDDQRHIAAVHFDPNLPLVIGFDVGMQPSAVFLQPCANGQVRVLAEVVPDHGCGASRLADLLVGTLTGQFFKASDVVAYGDPAAQYGADREAGENTALEIVQRRLGVPVLIPGDGSNEIEVRLEAVRGHLRATIDGRTPALLVDPSCKYLIKGFASKYRFRRERGASDVFVDRPDKSQRPYADVHDALQYACLGIQGRMGVIAAAVGETRGRNAAGWGAARPAKFNVF